MNNHRFIAALDKLLALARLAHAAEIDYGACGTEIDRRRMHEAAEEYDTAYLTFTATYGK